MPVTMEMIVVLTFLPISSSFLWNLFGNHGCNCCRCPSTASVFSTHNSVYSNTMQSHFQYPTSSNYRNMPVFRTFNYPSSSDYTVSTISTSTSTYRGPPSAAPVNSEQLYPAGSRYSTNQVVYHSEIRPVSAVEYGDHALTQLEEELATEKYKYNLQKEQERKQKQKQKQQKIRVFKIKPHKSSTGMVEWQSSQVAKYTNEKAKFAEATSSNNVNEEDLEEFIPIEIGSEPELAAEEPAGPPPNVRNKISHDPVLNLRRRFVLT